MNTVKKIAWYALRDTVRGRWGIIYFSFFLLLTETMFRLGGQDVKVILTLMNVTVVMVPLFCIVFGTMYYYNSREFIEMLLTQPVNRARVFAGLYFGLGVALGLGFLLGTGLPALFHGRLAGATAVSFLLLLWIGLSLTFTFVGLAFFLSTRFDDKGKGLGATVLAWLFLAVIYDGLVLLGVYLFGDYPLETPMLVVSMSNPIDLARILLIMQTDISALMGYTGAVFERFFGSRQGMLTAFSCLTAWTVLPYVLGVRRFARKDF